MTLVELRKVLAHLTALTPADAELRDKFIVRLDAWTSDTTSAKRLLDDLNRLLGHIWFSSPSVHRDVWLAIQEFAKEVELIDGMTVNERLFVFGLLDTWDGASEPVRLTLRAKVGA